MVKNDRLMKDIALNIGQTGWIPGITEWYPVQVSFTALRGS